MFVRLAILVVVASWLLPPKAACASEPTWTVPTAEELAMTSVPQVPGAAAVVLYHEEKTVDLDRSTTLYVRIKILNESGKDYATVELPVGGSAEIDYRGLAGRTIHSDGNKAYEHPCFPLPGQSHFEARRPRPR
jgi:hypothetical protein